MLTLVILRHAKAVPHQGDDFERELTERGQSEAANVGRFFAEKNMAVDLALVSPAARTRETFLGVVAKSRAIHVEYERELYNAGAGQLRKRIALLGAETKTAMVVGHNPGMVELAVSLAQDGDPSEIATMRDRFPPATLAIIGFRHDTWDEAMGSGGSLLRYLTPDRLA